MFIPKPASPSGPEFRDPPLFPVSRNVRKYAFYMVVSRFTDICASYCGLTVRDHHNELDNNDVGV